MFRDMCDYVYDWPYDHFKEVVFLPGFADVVACLPAVPFIYAQPGPPTERFAKYMLPLLERAGKKFVFVTGQSAYGVPLKPGGVQQILASPALIRWFGQYPNAEHTKFEPLPVGLNCFEHAPELFRTLQQIGTYKQLVSPEHKSSLLMVNFSPKTNPIRKKLIDKYCHGGGFAHCFPKGQNNNIQGNPHLVAFYNNASRFKYALCPPGQGMDSHRTWEMLLLGVVPIVEHSRMDFMWDSGDLPVLAVRDLLKLPSKAELEALYDEKFGSKMALFKRARLGRQFWLDKFESFRRGHLAGGAEARRRCWHGKPHWTRDEAQSYCANNGTKHSPGQTCHWSGHQR